MNNNAIEPAIQKLINETDGVKFSNLKDKLIKTFGETEREKVLQAFIQYTKEGQLLHWRNYLLSDIIRLVYENETTYVTYFEWTLTEPKLTYWGIDGLFKVKGKEAYDAVIGIINNENLSKEIRGKAIKSLSIISNQTFDRGLPNDPGYWSPEDFRIAEILAWQQQGKKDGEGHTAPKTHSSLEDPKTPLEKLIVRLNKKLIAKRGKNQDLVNPFNWLAIADENDIQKIEQHWALPENYLLFLKNYSPIRVTINGKKYFQGLDLYGASKLIKAQEGYSVNPTTQEPIKDWPANYVVIADAGADSYCIDLNAIHENDAPIYTSMHGAGKWEFELYASSFMEFLKELGTK